MNSRGELTLPGQAKQWPTPVARDDQKSPEAHLAMKERMGGNRTAVTSLTVTVKQWPTPATADGERKSEAMLRGNPTLLGSARQWPTPAAHNAKGAGDSQLDRNTPGLPILARQWPTPRASDGTRGTDPPHGQGGDSLKTTVTHQPRTTPPDGPNGSPKVDLNPEFVAALMGLPPGWLTPYTSAETDSSPSAPAPPGNCSPNDSGRTDA